MSEPKHTPGEWRVGFENAGIMAQCIERNPGWIPVTGPCMSFAFGAVVAMVDGEANARLIAAAPEMYEALRTLTPWIDELLRDGDAKERKAIDKAYAILAELEVEG